MRAIGIDEDAVHVEDYAEAVGRFAGISRRGRKLNSGNRFVTHGSTSFGVSRRIGLRNQVGLQPAIVVVMPEVTTRRLACQELPHLHRWINACLVETSARHSERV
jgi:hypothetical protein